ncbi:MAG TPA: hypothetical protein VEL31_21805 [Ktedonobacteraceae bacterium]|nr:hypothetical protein [Ktedonobacteraceae bacterium]
MVIIGVQPPVELGSGNHLAQLYRRLDINDYHDYRYLGGCLNVTLIGNGTWGK